MIRINQNNIIHLSINSSYFCNFRCPSCYLTEQQLLNKELLPLDKLDERLNEIKAYGVDLGHADVYGGEIMLYPQGYLLEMKALLHSHGIKEIELITNLSTYKPEIVEDLDFGISVSYDFEHRPAHENVFKNMLKIQRPFTILTLANRQICDSDVEQMLRTLSLFKNLMAWEIKPYSSNQANQQSVTDADFEDLVMRVLTSEHPRHFEFLNESVLLQAVQGQRNSFSDDHVYITPNGDFGVLEFDLNNNEFFKTLPSFQDYANWTILEKTRVYENEFCSNCEYAGKCISEHLRPVKSMDNSCNGYYHLIKWAEANL